MECERIGYPRRTRCRVYRLAVPKSMRSRPFGFDARLSIAGEWRAGREQRMVGWGVGYATTPAGFFVTIRPGPPIAVEA